MKASVIVGFPLKAFHTSFYTLAQRHCLGFTRYHLNGCLAIS